MCGIVGFVGKRKCVKSLIETLSKLEYRGYDSAGVSWFENQVIKTLKKTGKIQNLIDEIDEQKTFSVGIAHTRWATHGKPNEINAHPHVSKNGTWAMVHNGIIENYKELKSKYNLNPESETDTAVLSELLEYSKAKNISDFIDVFENVDGSFAISAICKNKPNSLFLAKNKSPLYVAENEKHEFMIASDPICFAEFSKEFYFLEDGEFAEISQNKITFYCGEKIEIKKQSQKLSEIFEDTSKGKFEHFMLKEIMEEKQVILNLIEAYKSKRILEKFDDWFLSKFNEIKFIGCGTAYHASLMGAKFVQKKLGKTASAEMASEFIYGKPNFINPKTLYVFVSQSGETADTLRALELVKENECTSIALTNVLYSRLAKTTDFILPISAGVEIAVASTKAYVCMLASIYLFCEFFNSKKNYEMAFENLKNLAENILKFDAKNLDKIAEEIATKKEAIFIGKDMDYITSLEASLKLKEVTYINSNSYPAGELKHGFLALVENGMPLFVFANQKEMKNKTLSAMNEAISRGANEIVFTNDKNFEGKNVIFCKSQDEILAQIECISAMQYLSYRVSILKNINPDQPRNLAKSVTVE